MMDADVMPNTKWLRHIILTTMSDGDCRVINQD